MIPAFVLAQTRVAATIDTIAMTIGEDIQYNIEVKDPLTCIQTIMFQDNKYYGYGDFRRPDAFASGNIDDW